VSRDILLEDVATVPMNAVTAKLALDMTGLKAGQTKLVTGGAGMLGGSVIQLAHRLGIVVVTIGATAQVAFLNALGADRVIERGSDIVKEIWKHYPCGVDALIDGALIGQEICAVVKDGGSAISLRKSHPIKDPRLHVDYVSVLNGMENAEIIGMVARLTSDGVLKPRVAEGGYFNFEQAEAAFRYFENGKHSGRIILNFANEDT
jgi:NADPH:quinone reductase-like Zn-dependent oxidoreductase